ncbi:MEDS domain-containing protein [Asanoa sp. WMMD1127]|uniref:MEDS domain-containing protein n=1 Tax=Asanoa sp. WMMD1127 TaxID=3016107 RepID=UPI00241777D0|nr:MEDS domain-containing protein [Asanoa sp. WMMD1127]MDG4826254.1 MEDS domain-containing protein [Asanoa sp. WMMD1127]
MRAAGAPVARPPAAGRHLGWAYADRAGFLAAAAEFLAEGRAAGERLWLVGDDLPAVDGVVPMPIHELYPPGTVVDPAGQVETYAAATEAALADGYAGLRVVADATPLVRTAAQLEAFASYEHQVDRYMADHPFSAMCGYDRRLLDRAAVADLACMHARHNVVEVAFRLHGAPGTGDVALSGELDVTGSAILARALDRAAPPVVDGELVVDASSLDFVDHRSLLQLAGYARDRGATAVLRTPLPAAARLVGLLRVPGIRVEAA